MPTSIAPKEDDIYVYIRYRNLMVEPGGDSGMGRSAVGGVWKT